MLEKMLLLERAEQLLLVSFPMLITTFPECVAFEDAVDLEGFMATASA